MSYHMKHFLQEKMRKNADRPFLHFEGKDVTYGELDLLTDRVASGLKKLGVKKGDKVCLMLPNCLEFVLAWLGLVKAGAVEVPVNTAHKGDLLTYLLNDSDAQVMIVDSRYLDVVKKIEGELNHLKILVVWEEEPGLQATFSRMQTKDFSFLLEEGEPEALAEEELNEQDDFCVQYTSGTTGPSKGVVMPHRYIWHTCTSNAKQLGYNRHDVLYSCLPLFHGNAQIMSVLSAMSADARMVLVRRFSASKFWEDIRAHGVTASNLPGSVISILLKQPPSPRDREHSLKVVFTAGTQPAAWVDFEERFGVKIIEGYGSTECGMILMNTVYDRRVGSIGKPTEGYQVKIFDENDKELPPGEVGEIVTRPDQPFCMMKEYYKMPDKTWEACRNLWFHTGDFGKRDEDNFFYYVDRKKDVIRRRGENISSFEVERSINAHPKVLESAAIAIPDVLGEYELKVVVVPRPEADLGYDELIEFCEEKMAYFMVPRYVEFRDYLPKTPTDRVEKYKLRQEGITQSTWDRQKNR